MSTTSESIIEMLKGGFMTNSAIAERLGLHRSATLRHLQKLESLTVVERFTKGAAIFWKLAHANAPAVEADDWKEAVDIDDVEETIEEVSERDTLSLIDELRRLEVRRREILEQLK